LPLSCDSKGGVDRQRSRRTVQAADLNRRPTSADDHLLPASQQLPAPRLLTRLLPLHLQSRHSMPRLGFRRTRISKLDGVLQFLLRQEMRRPAALLGRKRVETRGQFLERGIRWTSTVVSALGLLLHLRVVQAAR